MKKVYFGLYVFIIALISACTVGVNKDLLTGLSYSYKGLSVEDAYLTVDNKKLSSNELEYGKKAYIILSGVEGFETDNGRVRIGCNIQLADAAGNIVLSADDAYAAFDEEGFDPEEVGMLNISLTIGTPIEAGNEYNWKAHFWDKNGEGEIDTEINIKIVSPGE